MRNTFKGTTILSALSAAFLPFSGCKTVEVEVNIQAKPATVWTVISDAKAYEQWNPVHVKVEGEFKQDGEVKIHLKEPGGKQSVFPARVRRFTLNRELNQGGGFPGIFTFNHTFQLEPVDGGTRLRQREEFRGIGVLFYNVDWVEDGYRSVNDAIKARAEDIEKTGRN